MLLTNSFPFYGVFLCSTGCFLCCTELFSFMSFHLSSGLTSWGNGVLFRTSILTPVGICLGFFCFSVLRFTLGSLTYLEWLCRVIDMRLISFFYIWNPVLRALFVKLFAVSGHCCQISDDCNDGAHAYVFYFVLLIYMLVLGPSHIIFINLALYNGLKYVMIILPNLLFCSVFLWISLVFHEPIFISEYFHVSVKKKSSVFLLKLYWTCKFCFVKRSFFAIPIPPIHKDIFHLSQSFSSETTSFHCICLSFSWLGLFLDISD